MSEFDEEQSEGTGLRRQLEAALQEKAKLETTLDQRLQEAEERGRSAARRELTAERTFESLGYPKMAGLWAKENPEGDLTPEGATEFLSNLGITTREQDEPKPASDPVPAEVQQQAKAFAEPTPATPVGSMLERAEFDQMMLDPGRRAEAIRAAQEGRVKLNDRRSSEIQVNDPANFFQVK